MVIYMGKTDISKYSEIKSGNHIIKKEEALIKLEKLAQFGYAEKIMAR